MAISGKGSDFELASPRERISGFRAYGALDLDTPAATPENFEALQAIFQGQVRRQLRASLRGRVPLDQLRGGITAQDFGAWVDTFTADAWDMKNRQTGEDRLLIRGYEATGLIDARRGRYSSAAQMLKQHWLQVEGAIVEEAARWFQEEIGVTGEIMAEPGEETGYIQPSRRVQGEMTPEDFRRELARRKAAASVRGGASERPMAPPVTVIRTARPKQAEEAGLRHLGTTVVTRAPQPRES